MSSVVFGRSADAVQQATTTRVRRTWSRPSAPRVLRTLTPFIAAAVVMAAWEALVATGAPPSSLAAPSAVWKEFAEDPGGLWFHVQPTLTAAIIGFTYATVVAVALSMVTVVVPRTTRAIYNVSVVTYSVPLIALAPVLLVWIGNGPSLRITIAAIAGFFPVVVGCIQGFRSVDRGRNELFEQLAASKSQRFQYLVIHESLPYVFAGLKVAAASAVLGAIISEWSGADRGLGLAMISALSGYNPAGVWLTIVAATSLTILLYSAIGFAERLTVRWDYDRDAVAGRS